MRADAADARSLEAANMSNADDPTELHVAAPAALDRLRDVRPPAELIVLPARATLKQLIAAIAAAFRDVYCMFKDLQVSHMLSQGLVPPC